MLLIGGLHLALVLENVLRQPNSGQVRRIATGNFLYSRRGSTTGRCFLLGKETDAVQRWRLPIGGINGRRNVVMVKCPVDQATMSGVA
ncbi:hypothetical protein HBI56_175600 [Parastagonospora nodorum]|uniref:Secreted protein n=1 Tax=Phaeosphaeria nodorum (strain SN15 / ATCC MYA-4574 / FGSC 10173) TaxID=321614 RepID=A0A7U2I5A3_PHANO|nr:hypothetical protein HBH56_121060 [Parastagonospora nodorum]QRD03921.1 hypothetical protein JI435_420490 [Parastagonospora nodorum SN15]KAH3924225.1 hypothetical protein HBH54_196960 [Parastagonospora nodorum]KAH3942398.1 hypothetical protein HBH53_186550 [Parastagonospora nodorum]KAH3961656.1 hypothetical protein HBH51_181730 [Parastagonospora nodorum]